MASRSRPVGAATTDMLPQGNAAMSARACARRAGSTTSASARICVVVAYAAMLHASTGWPATDDQSSDPASALPGRPVASNTALAKGCRALISDVWAIGYAIVFISDLPLKPVHA